MRLLEGPSVLQPSDNGNIEYLPGNDRRTTERKGDVERFAYRETKNSGGVTPTIS